MRISPGFSPPSLRSLRHYGEAAIFFLFMGLFWAIRLDAASATGGFIGRHVFYRFASMNRARENLRAAYPLMTAGGVETIVLGMCDNLGRTVAEYPHIGRLSTCGRNPRIQMNTRIGHVAVADGKGVVFVTGHFANWEVMTAAAGMLDLEGGFVYRPPNNPFVDRWISRQRLVQGPREQIKKGAPGVRRMVRLLREGRAVFMLADQKTGEGVAAPFFGRDAMTTPAPAALALKLGVPVVPVSATRLGGAHFRVDVHPAIAFTASGDHDRDVLMLTAKINASLEDMVRASPSQWLWLHRRWSRPKDGDLRLALMPQTKSISKI